MGPPRARMTVGGKLSFRKRVQRIDVPDGELPLVIGGDDPPSLAELTGSTTAPIEVEVGPGKGAFLIAGTEARPDSFWVGIEAAQSYAELAAARLHTTGRTNGVFLVDNAALYVRDRCPPASVARMHVYYPDPWPKRRHRARRFFEACPPEALHRVIADDGLLLVATDNAGYAGQIVRKFGASPLFHRDRDLEAELAARPGVAFSPTNFERKYVTEGRILRQFAFTRVG